MKKKYVCPLCKKRFFLKYFYKNHLKLSLEIDKRELEFWKSEKEIVFVDYNGLVSLVSEKNRNEIASEIDNCISILELSLLDVEKIKDNNKDNMAVNKYGFLIINKEELK